MTCRLGMLTPRRKDAIIMKRSGFFLTNSLAFLLLAASICIRRKAELAKWGKAVRESGAKVE